MATLDDSVLDRLSELGELRHRAKELRQQARAALAEIPKTLAPGKHSTRKKTYDLSSGQWVSGPHPIDLALLARVLNHRDLVDFDSRSLEDLYTKLTEHIVNSFQGRRDPETPSSGTVIDDEVPVLTAARAMHALVRKPESVFSTATMLCYYQIIRELYLAAYPNWIIGAARAGEGGRVSAFVTGECVRAILSFQNTIRETILFCETTRKLYSEYQRLNQLPDVDHYLRLPSQAENSAANSSEAHWKQYLDIEYERIALDWCAANNLRRHVIALDLSPATSPSEAKPSVPGIFSVDSTKKIGRDEIETALSQLPSLLRTATKEAKTSIKEAKRLIEEFRLKEAGLLDESDIKDLRLFAKKLSEDEYARYKAAIAPKTQAELTMYSFGDSHSSKRDEGRLPPDEPELKRALVEQLNSKFKKSLLACDPHWAELERRVRNDGKRSITFPQELEWLIERHRGVIKLVVDNKDLEWEGSSELIQLNRLFLEEAFSETVNGEKRFAFKPVDRRQFDVTLSAHGIAHRVVGEALDEAEVAADKVREEGSEQPLVEIIDHFLDTYRRIYNRIHRTIEPAKRYIQAVLNRELALASRSAKFDAGELLFAAACFGALTKWKDNEQLNEARRLLISLLPEDGRLPTARPIQSDAKGLRLIPIAFEMSRCFAQLLQRDDREDLEPKIVKKLLNVFEEKPIYLSRDSNEHVGWNFSGAPESQRPCVWVTSVAVFALDRTVKMLDERINAMVLRHFKVDWPDVKVESLENFGSKKSGKSDLNSMLCSDYELQSAFNAGDQYENEYKQNPHRVDNVSVAIRLQQMRAHLTGALLPRFYTRQTSAIFYGPPGTGKTTLAEALATTARVPLVRLSPSDLMVQGTDVIESRARAIFDSLSMLTEVVIFLDEFEPVVRTRGRKKDENRPEDPAEFKFLVTGMLPKLTRLNEVAKEQSIVYCLATNHLVEVDDAAKRVGRFDLHIPIYNPDPMSRLGSFLSRLIATLQEQNIKWESLKDDPSFWLRVKTSICETKEVSAQSLAKTFFTMKRDTGFINYAQGLVTECPHSFPEMPAEQEKTTVEKDIEDQRRAYEDDWSRRKIVAQ
jgi:hypothetical protein